MLSRYSYFKIIWLMLYRNKIYKPQLIFILFFKTFLLLVFFSILKLALGNKWNKFERRETERRGMSAYDWAHNDNNWAVMKKTVIEKIVFLSILSTQNFPWIYCWLWSSSPPRKVQRFSKIIWMKNMKFCSKV